MEGRSVDGGVIRVESLAARLSQGYQVSPEETSFPRQQLSPVPGGECHFCTDVGGGLATRAHLEGTRTLA